MNKALHVVIEHIAEMKQAVVPDIPTPPDIDLEKLADAEKPVVLKLGQVGAVSKSRTSRGKQRVYGRQFYESLVSEINQKRPEGAWGHVLDPKRRAEHYEEPAVRWIGATIDDNGTVWGKLIPQREDAQRHLRIAETTGANVATSLLGWVKFDQKGEGVSIDLENIDLAHPSRAGVKDAVSPVFTSEMATEEDEDMKTIEELMAELASVRQDANEQRELVGELNGRISDLETASDQLSELREFVAEQSGVFEQAGIPLGDDVIATMRGLVQQLQHVQVTERLRQADELVAEMVKLEKMRPLVRNLLQLPSADDLDNPEMVAEMWGRVPEADDLKEQITALLEQEHLQQISQALVGEQAGPSAIVGNQDKTDAWRDEAAKKAEDVAREVGAI